ncbi:hypothetical protein C8J56DRAFT_1176609 [Mycena floridula]|nr:hypothetical protein C8J56DRAFT_1176609 [Mycena floridula]
MYKTHVITLITNTTQLSIPRPGDSQHIALFETAPPGSVSSSLSEATIVHEIPDWVQVTYDIRALTKILDGYDAPECKLQIQLSWSYVQQWLRFAFNYILPLHTKCTGRGPCSFTDLRAFVLSLHRTFPQDEPWAKRLGLYLIRTWIHEQDLDKGTIQIDEAVSSLQRWFGNYIEVYMPLQPYIRPLVSIVTRIFRKDQDYNKVDDLNRLQAAIYITSMVLNVMVQDPDAKVPSARLVVLASPPELLESPIF